ncbi:MAG: lipase family protein [Saccharofermentanales bacterium]
MYSKKRLDTDILELDQIDPKYIPFSEMNRNSQSLSERVSMLEHYVYLQPGDPWMASGDKLIRLPFPPDGGGLSMQVCAYPVVKSLGGKFVLNPATGKLKLVREDSFESFIESDMTTHPELRILTMKLCDILIPLKMGIIILDNGSVYISERKQFLKLQPQCLDDDYRVILHPFRDEHLFARDIITDEWGFKRQRYDKELAIRSLSFSKAAYNMHILPFISDGWLDYTMVYEGRILSKADDWNIEPTRRKQLASSIKQLINTQSAKAVIMGRTLSDQTAVVNITFTGTKHTADWLNNFKVGVSNKLHKGFYELAAQFDAITEQIRLPLLAGMMGMDGLTLTQVFEEAKKPGSRFRIWITGHSQGGALTQVYIAEFLMKKGVLPENIIGYSFASPSVATAHYCERPGDFPVYNINNADDFATHVGSALRLGMDLMFYPDEEFRRQNYKDYDKPEIRAMYADILKLCYWMTDSFKFGEFMIAMATFATKSPVAKNFIVWIEETPLLRNIYRSFSKKADISKAIHDRMYKLLEKPYMDVGGKPPSEERISEIISYLNILFYKWGIDCLSIYVQATHQIPKNYSSIVQKEYNDFKRAIWPASNPPELLTHDGTNLLQEIPFPEISPLRPNA